MALLHLFLYDVKTFGQVQAKSKLSSVIGFMNAPGILGQFFIHRCLDLHVSSWLPMLMSKVLRHGVFFEVVYFLKQYGITFMEQLLNKKLWFSLAVYFLGSKLPTADKMLHFSNDYFYNSIMADTIDKTKDILLNSGLVSFNIYTDSSVKCFGSMLVVVKAVVFYANISVNIKAKIQNIMFLTLAELKAITLALICIPLGCSVIIYSDSQAVISACIDELDLAMPDFKKHL
ncbi:hypothetical protein G9A89_021151 [Geosiphon pyriformis]|nr:hypothetical protein G9A89_021151 [Geosiphon pyriformis]